MVSSKVESFLITILLVKYGEIEELKKQLDVNVFYLDEWRY